MNEPETVAAWMGVEKALKKLYRTHQVLPASYMPKGKCWCGREVVLEQALIAGRVVLAGQCQCGRVYYRM